MIKEQEGSGLLSSLGIKILILCKLPSAGDILFQRYKKNEIVNKFLLAADKFMPEMHLRQSGFTYSACGILTKTKQKNLKT